jgi:hypothetical protein
LGQGKGIQYFLERHMKNRSARVKYNGFDNFDNRYIKDPKNIPF